MEHESITTSERRIRMMEELKKIETGMIPVYETSTGEKVVYGAELYECLGGKRQYADWIKSRFVECDAIENEDYQAFSQNCEKPTGGRPKHEYIIKLDIAKEMAMLECNEKGREVSRYLNAIERRKTMDNKVSVFKNGDLDLEMRTILNDDGSISVNAEDTAIGLGWVDTSQRATSGSVLIKVRWARMNKYSSECGFPHELGKDDYIPESLFYMFAMKANNERAQRFQRWIAIDVVPAIRRTGVYDSVDGKVLQQLIERIDTLESRLDSRVTHCGNPFTLTDFSERKEKLDGLVNEVARLCKLGKSKVLHYLYRTIEENLKVSIDSIKSFYKLETGNEVSTFETVIQNNHLYIEAVRLCEETIERKKIFG